LIFWGGLAIGLSLFSLLSTAEYREGLWPGDTRTIAPQVREGVRAIRQHPWMVVLIAPLGFVLDLACVGVRAGLGVRLLARARATARWGCYAVAGLLIASLGLSLVRDYPRLALLDVVDPAPVGAYVVQVLSAMATGLRLTHPDLLLSSSFWAGFGWIETMPGDWFVALGVLFSGGASVMLLLYLGWTGDLRRILWLAVLGGGWVVAIVLYAVSSYFLFRNLHGRYLVGVYLSMLAVAWSSAALIPRLWASEPRHGLGLGRESLLLAAISAVHAYALSFILGRYY
jgi:hypothetical protein